MSPVAGSPAARVADVKRELLVRHLEAWTPAALHRARRATYAHGYADADDARAAEAALRVFTEQSDLVRGRELAMVAVADDATGPIRRLSEVQREAGPSAGLVVHTVPGGTDDRLGVALQAAGAARKPLFGYLDASAAPAPPASTTLAALGAGKPVEVILVLAADVLPRLAAGDPTAGDIDLGDRMFGDDRWRAGTAPAPDLRIAVLVRAYRSVLRDAGFPLTAAVELVAGDADDPGELLVFATTSGKSLEGFKEALWAADEYAGVRYRDPGDPQRHPIDISLSPHPGPLRRELLAHLAAVGPRSVTELRTFTLTETVYRAADANGVLNALLTAGAVTREPANGRLGGDVVIAATGPAAPTV
jgi:three-Cys-motif partner protein